MVVSPFYRRENRTSERFLSLPKRSDLRWVMEHEAWSANSKSCTSLAPDGLLIGISVTANGLDPAIVLLIKGYNKKFGKKRLKWFLNEIAYLSIQSVFHTVHFNSSSFKLISSLSN